VTGVETAGNWCVRYYTANLSVGKTVTIKANMIPKVVKLVMETQLNSSDVNTNKIGIVQIIAPTVTLSGAFSIAMKADGVANTPLTGTALAYYGDAGTGCGSDPYYAEIIEIIDDTDWWDDVIGLSVEGGDFTIGNSTTSTLVVWAIPAVGAAFIPPVGDLDFNLVGTPTATGTTVGLHTAIVTSSTTDGSAVIKANITSATTIDTTVTVTVL
jgi:hypothetical protein